MYKHVNGKTRVTISTGESLSENVFVFQNGDVIRRCLDFINFVCLHLRVSSKSLPVEFLDSVWSLLIDILRQGLSSTLSPVSQKGPTCNSPDGRLTAHNNESRSLEKTVAMVTSVFEIEEFERHVELLLSDLVNPILYNSYGCYDLCKCIFLSLLYCFLHKCFCFRFCSCLGYFL